MTFDDMFEHIQSQVSLCVLDKMQKRIGMVSGSINADGCAYKQRNILRLMEFSQLTEQKVKYPIFCAPYFFDDAVYLQYNKHSAVYEDYMFFWRKVLLSGIVTDLFMMPGWERSTGAQDEYNTAKNCGIMIHIESA